MSSLPPNTSYGYMNPVLPVDELNGEDGDIEKVVQSEKHMKQLSMCQLTTNACALLGLPVWSACTACYYQRRFYAQFSMDKYDPVIMSQACILLSAKVHECLTRIRDVVTVVYHLLKSPDGIQQCVPTNSEYWVLKPKLVDMEHYLLRGLNFYTDVDLPHNYVLLYARAQEQDVHVTNSAFYICNDMYNTDVILEYDAQSLATAALVFACHQYHNVPVPDMPYEAPKLNSKYSPGQATHSATPRKSSVVYNASLQSSNPNTPQVPTALHDLLITGDVPVTTQTTSALKDGVYLSKDGIVPDYLSVMPLPKMAPTQDTEDMRMLHYVTGHIANRKCDNSTQHICNTCDIPREVVDNILDKFVYIYDIHFTSVLGRCTEK